MTSPRALQRLASDEFLSATFGLSTASGLAEALRRLRDIDRLREDIRVGAVTNSDIREFAREILGRLVRGQKLAEETSLAAIAVALETIPGSFAQDFLTGLAELRVGEIPLAPRVAVIVLQIRQQYLPELTERSYILTSPIETNSMPKAPFHREPMFFGHKDTTLDSVQLAL